MCACVIPFVCGVAEAELSVWKAVTLKSFEVSLLSPRPCRPSSVKPISLACLPPSITPSLTSTSFFFSAEPTCFALFTLFSLLLCPPLHLLLVTMPDCLTFTSSIDPKLLIWTDCRQSVAKRVVTDKTALLVLKKDIFYLFLFTISNNNFKKHYMVDVFMMSGESITPTSRNTQMLFASTLKGRRQSDWLPVVNYLNSICILLQLFPGVN